MLKSVCRPILKSGEGVRVAHIHSTNTFLSFVTTMSVCRPIVLSSQLGEGCRVPNTQWQLHLIVLSSKCAIDCVKTNCAIECY